MISQELRNKFLDFFKKKGHVIVPSSSLLPDDPSVLLTTAGMQQFKPYYTGDADPLTSIHGTLGKPLGSKNVASIQKSFRTSDINEVGDESHLTFFEMLGNFSFGGYFKKEAIEYAYEFIVKELGLKIDYVSVFGGDRDVPEDKESAEIWKSLGIKEKDIHKAGREDNFWGPTGNQGPCGPTTEIYVKGVEIWNIVFNEHFQHSNKKLEKLSIPGVDTGMGLERLAMVVQGKSTIFETDLFASLIEKINVEDVRVGRILADHLRGAVFLIADGVRPSNVEAGYILRRLLRRAIRLAKLHKLDVKLYEMLGEEVIKFYKNYYLELAEHKKEIIEVLLLEQEKFGSALERGLKEFEKMAQHKVIGGRESFYLYQSYGFPFELLEEMAREKGVNFSKEEFEKELAKHQEISRAGVEKKFGGHGLIMDTGELKAGNEQELQKVTRLHTATHLLNQALHDILGDEIEQRGSDITPERTRFDFKFNRKVAAEELKKIEEIVNKKIKEDLPITITKMKLEDALKSGARAFFKLKYPPEVNVYSIGDYSKELCGGPHVQRTGEIGRFKITKEESSSAGVRRIRAVVEP
ncbi:alanine--tRNA ligase [Candidatus Parcubacteria bacterium]|nr:MAG: alanine--tRNA ligase [Candidatus Parcubacteria bacterium]